MCNSIYTCKTRRLYSQNTFFICILSDCDVAAISPITISHRHRCKFIRFATSDQKHILYYVYYTNTKQYQSDAMMLQPNWSLTMGMHHAGSRATIFFAKPTNNSGFYLISVNQSWPHNAWILAEAACALRWFYWGADCASRRTNKAHYTNKHEIRK